MPRVTTTLYGDLAILPYPAEAPVREVLEYFTDVLIAYNSTEDRKPLRELPRQSFGYSIVVQTEKIAEEFNTLFKALRNSWAIPVWHEEQLVRNISIGATSIPCVTEFYDYRDSGLALLYSPNGSWELLQINLVNPFSISLSTPTAQAFELAWMVPVRRGWVEKVSRRDVSHHDVLLNLTMIVDDNPIISPITPPQFLSSDIYYDPIIMSKSNATAFDQRLELHDEELGPVTRRSPWTRAQYSRSKAVRTRGAEAARLYKQFLARRQGRYRQFWYPTFERNLRLLSTGTITTTMLVANDSYLTYATERTHIAIEVAGVWYPRTVTSAPSGGDVQLTLDTALGFDASLISQICYLGLNRLDTDRIELSWLGNQVMESAVQLLELSP